MGTRAGYGNGIQLQITESLDDTVAAAAGTPAFTRRPRREAREPGFQQARPGQRKAPRLS